MARPIQKSIDYYPLNCNFLNDIKVRRIMKSCGASSIAVLIHLLGNIYGDEGYFMLWNGDVAFLIADSIGLKENEVIEVVNKALEVGFFHAALYDKYGILTSKGIQDRYFKATEKRKKDHVVPNYLLINIGLSEVTETETIVNDEETQVSIPVSTQIKEDKIKEKEIKGDDIKKYKNQLNRIIKNPSSSTENFLGYFQADDWPKLLDELEHSAWLKENLNPDQKPSRTFMGKILSGKYRDFSEPKKRRENIGGARSDQYSDKELQALADHKWQEARER